MLRDRPNRPPTLRALVLALVAGTTLGGVAFAGPAFAAPAPQASDGSNTTVPAGRTVSMPDGTTITIAPNGDAKRTTAKGALVAETLLPLSAGGSALGAFAAPSDDAVRARFTQLAAASAPHDVLAVLADTTTVTGAAVTGKQADGTRAVGARAAVTSNAQVNAAFAKFGANSVTPLFAQLPADQVRQLSTDARSRLGGDSVDLSKAVVVHLAGGDADAAAAALRATPGVTYAEPDRAVSDMSTGATPLPTAATTAARKASARPVTNPDPTLPDNYGLTSSLQSFLNAGGVDAEGAYSTLQSRLHQLPGAGEVITNVSIGDLTDESMADAGDGYVSAYGPTTVVQGGQRYLDLPSMPLIPTYTASPAGTLDPTGSAEDEDPSLGEVMLDFGVMAPLPHSAQRPTATGSGDTDLLGIAPGAQYRLVVPQQPTTDQISVALLAAARQNPRPNVITASLGFGTDVDGFPGRYLEDDPIEQAVIAAIVQEYHIVVCISANDGTRLYTPAAVGPDGGSTATDTTRDPRATTDIDDDADSTAPSEVLDSGAIAVGGTTLDDTLAVPPQSGAAQSHDGTFAATRTDGGGEFSSGFGTRIDVSAPSDGVASFEHPQGGTAQDVIPVLNGGTSASAPMTAAAAAVVLQASRMTGQSAGPDDVRSLLERTGRTVSSPPQADQQIHVGPQIDLTAAVDAVLDNPKARTPKTDSAGSAGSADNADTAIARVSVAHRQTLGDLGGSFTEDTDPGRIDLSGPGTGTDGTGEGLVGPVTIAADVTGLPQRVKPDYVLLVGRQEFHSATPSIRLTPTELLTAAKLPVVSTGDRTISYTFQVRDGSRVLAVAQRQLTFGATDGTYDEALAPVVPATVRAGSSVRVAYDLTGVRSVNAPQLVVSTVGHWNPATAPIFSAAATIPLTGTKGTVTVPASAFDGGGGIYGIGIDQDSSNADSGFPVYGEFASIRVDGATAAQRPTTPTLAVSADGRSGGQFGHYLEVSRAAPAFSLRYDVRNVPGATGAAVEVSAPAPTLFNALNTVTNANGTTRDHDGVDAGSVAYRALPGRDGTQTLDAVRLGLGGSLDYNVRVFATDRAGHILGQASPTSMLTVDDGPAPDGGEVASFAAQASGQSVVSVRDPSGGESVREYQTPTGRYGTTLATDASSEDGYDVVGVDPSAHRAIVLHWHDTGAWSLQTYDTASGKSVADAAGSDDYTVLGGRVDTTRHRAVVLAHRTSDKADVVFAVDLATGAMGAAIPADAPGVTPGTYGLIDVDQTTGVVLLAKLGGGLICFFGSGTGIAASLDLDTDAVTPSASADGCSGHIAVDQGTHTLYELSYRSFSVNIAGTTNLVPVTGDPLTSGTPLAVRAQPALTLAVDSVHHLALVAFQTPLGKTQFGSINGIITDNNATSQVAVVDLSTGKTLSLVSGFDFGTGFLGGEYDSSTERAIQLDPATRTGWTSSPDGTQVQRFTY
jgi:hypothetical protein